MFELNGFAVNGSAVNGSEAFGAFTSASGVGALIAVEQSVDRSEIGGALVALEQTVARVGGGSLVAISQTVILRTTGSGSLVAVEQVISNDTSGALIVIEQTVRQSIAAGNVALYGWDLILHVGGVEISSDQIHGTVTVTRNENSSALMDVTLINRSGIQDFSQWHGKRVTLDVERASGITRIYTGVVDIPEIDLVLKRIKLRCTDRRKEQINTQLASQLPFIGSWSDAVFDTADDTAELLAQRLLTTTKTVDFDAYGNYTISSFLPKATPDFTLTDADIFRRNPTLEVASRGRLVNRVNVEFEYRYTRLRHRERTFELYGASFCDVMTVPGLAFLSVSGITSNVANFGWPLKPNTLGFTYLPPAGWYNCGEGKFLWAPTVISGTTSIVKDEDGNIVTDSKGNPVTKITNQTVTDYTEAFATEATWVAAKDFAQDVTEKINIEVNAPQSQNQYGVIEETQRNGYQHEYETIDFERGGGYQSPDGFISTAGDHYLDKTGTPAHYKAALRTVISMAETKIHKSHRDNHIKLETDLWPEIDLRHTVATAAGVIQGKGKATKITHVFDISNRDAYTTTRLSFSQSQGAQAAESLTIPILNAPLIGGFGVNALKMYTYEGSIQGGIAAGTESTGLALGSNTDKTLGMITPAIDDESRNRQEVISNYTYNTAIQNDTLTVTF